MGISLPLPRFNPPALLRALAMLAVAAGVGVWGAILLAPSPGAMPPALPAASTQGFATAPVAQWFGGGNARVKVTVVGLIAGGAQQGAALLSVNGAPAQAYRIGQTLAPGIVLAGVSRDAVSVDQDGVIEQVAVPRNPTDVIQGFVPAASARQPAAADARR